MKAAGLKILRVPSLDGGSREIVSIEKMWREAEGMIRNDTVQFDFSLSRFLDPRAVVLVGGLVHTLRQRGCVCSIGANTMRGSIRTNLEQNGFASAMGAQRGPWLGNSIPYREDLVENKDGIVRYLEQEWLGRGWMSVSKDLAHAIVGQVWEIYANAFEHGASGPGVLTCGQYFPQLKQLAIAIGDFGVGIPRNVRTTIGASASGEIAMRWAMTRGTTTAKTSPLIARGLGLDLLKAFVEANNGMLDICSGDGRVVIDGASEKFQTLQNGGVRGTIVHLRLRCDGKQYDLRGPAQEGPYF